MRRALKDSAATPCLWHRGQIPASWARVPPPVAEDVITNLGHYELARVHWNGIVFGAGDASGGESTSDARFRRIGWSALVLNCSAGVADSHLDR